MKRLALMACAGALLGSCALHEDRVTESDLSKLSDVTTAVFASDGYGYILDTADDMQVYNITDTVCLAITEEQESPLIYFDRFKLNASKGELELFNRFEPYPITFKSIQTVPPDCLKPVKTDALTIFDSFVSFYDEHYGFFDIHGVNWSEATREMRQGLNAESSEMELVERFIGLLSQLRDGHVSISATVNGEEGQFIAYPGRTNAAVQAADTGDRNPKSVFGEQYLRQDIEQAILGGYGFDALNERMKYGITSDDIGYLAIMSEGGFADGEDPSFEEEITALRLAMAQIVRTFEAASVKAVIVDLSVNTGGYDFLGREIVRYFTDEPQFIYSKFASDAEDQTPFPFTVTPADGPRYTGPIYIMTSDATVSAGESLALALRTLPNSTHVGETTRGAFSDVLVKYLPNGWEITLSNEVYTDKDGTVWEGIGIKPDIEIQVFEPGNPLAGHMPAIEKLITIIDEAHGE